MEDGSWHLRGMEFHFIELPKLRRRRKGPETGLERMLEYLGNMGGEENMKVLANEDWRVAKMAELETLFRNDPDLLRDYLIREDNRRDYEYSLRESERRGREQMQRSFTDKLIAASWNPKEAAAFTGLSD